MKKANVLGLLSLLMVLMMNLTFSSCNKDDDDDDVSSASIVGQWKMVSYSGDMDDEDKAYIDAQIASGLTYTFNEGGQGSVYANGMTLAFTYTKSGDKVTLESGLLEEGELIIVKLTSSELSFKDEDGTVVNFKKK